jgi:hypothetical protein
MQVNEISGNIAPQIAVPYAPAAAVGGGQWFAPFKMKIVSALWIAGAAITGQATNFFTLSFFNRGGAGAGTVQWATAIAYSSGGVTAAKATPVTLTLSSTASDLLVAASDVLSVEITTTGTGLICPGGVVYLNATLTGS